MHEPTCFEHTDCAPCDVCANGLCRAGSPVEACRPASVDAGIEDAGFGDAVGQDAITPTDATPDGGPDASDTGQAPDFGVGRDVFVYETSASELQIRSLTVDGCTAIREHVSQSGHDQVGMAIDRSHLFVTGAGGTVTLALPDLTTTQTVATTKSPHGPYRPFSDLRTETAYVLAAGTPLGPVRNFNGAVTISHLLTLSGTTANGLAPARPIPLSPALTTHEVPDFYSGYGFAVVHESRLAHLIEIPSGRVLELGPMRPFSSHTDCANGIGGVAERFGGHIYLVAPDATVPHVAQIKRHRVPDGATAVVAELGDLGFACRFSMTATAGRWYLDWSGDSQLGNADQAAIGCDAELEVAGGDGIQDVDVIRKPPIPNDPYVIQLLGSVQGAMFSSFVAPTAGPSGSHVLAIGLWLDDDGSDPMRLVAQIWGTNAVGFPDVNDILATSEVISPVVPASTYVEIPLQSTAMGLLPGEIYWVALSTSGVLQPPTPGYLRVARHARNSDGVYDDGRLLFGDGLGGGYEGPSDTWSELATVISFGP